MSVSACLSFLRSQLFYKEGRIGVKRWVTRLRAFQHVMQFSSTSPSAGGSEETRGGVGSRLGLSAPRRTRVLSYLHLHVSEGWRQKEPMRGKWTVVRVSALDFTRCQSQTCLCRSCIRSRKILFCLFAVS